MPPSAPTLDPAPAPGPDGPVDEGDQGVARASIVPMPGVDKGAKAWPPTLPPLALVALALVTLGPG